MFVQAKMDRYAHQSEDATLCVIRVRNESFHAIQIGCSLKCFRVDKQNGLLNVSSEFELVF